MSRRRQTANIPNPTQQPLRSAIHVNRRHYGMRLFAIHASQTEPPQLTWPAKPDSRVYKTEDVNRSDPNYPNDGFQIAKTGFSYDKTAKLELNALEILKRKKIRSFSYHSIPILAPLP